MKEPGKPRGKPFVKGDPRAGRPAGSKNGSTICKDWADTFGFDFLKRVAQGDELFVERKIDEKGKEKVTKRTAYVSERTVVAIYLIDRAYGKPTQAHDVDITAKIVLGEILDATHRAKPSA